MSNSIHRGEAGRSQVSSLPNRVLGPSGAAVDRDAVRYILVCLLAVPVVFWLLGPFMGMAALIVLATLFFVWREPGAPNLPLLWEDHYEQPGRAE